MAEAVTGAREVLAALMSPDAAVEDRAAALMALPEDERLAVLQAIVTGLKVAAAKKVAGAEMFVCSGRGEAGHGGTVSVSVTDDPPAGLRPGRSMSLSPATEFACPACGRRTRFGARRMGLLREAFKDGRLAGPVDISLC